MMNHQWWQHHDTQRDIKLTQQMIWGHQQGSVLQVQLDQCNYQGFSKRKKDQSAAAAKVRVELES